MKVCIYSNESIQVLEKWAIELFSPIQNLSLSPRDTSPYKNAFLPGQNLNKILEIVPIKDKDILELNWVLPENLARYFKSKPEHLLGHLFGHEGPNSLLSLLKDEGLATALNQSSEFILDLFTTFSVKIDLTKKGFERYADVCELVFCFLSRLKQKSFGEWQAVFEELSQTEKISFFFKDKSREIEYCSKIVQNMVLYPVENALNASYILESFDYDLIHRVLQQFTCENLLIFLHSKSFQGKTSCSEKYFNVQYNSKEIPQDLIARLENPKGEFVISRKTLDFPPKNAFIPTNFEVLPKELNWPEPKKIYESDRSIFWFKQGSDFGLPKISINLKIFLEKWCYESVKNLLCMNIWLEILQYQINEIYYMAEMAKIFSNFRLESNGIHLVVNGFSDSAPKYLQGAIRNMLFISNESREKFKDCYDKLLIKYTNFFRKLPSDIVRELGFATLISNGIYRDPKVILETMKSLNFEDFSAFETRWLSKFFCEWFINGNVAESDALSIVKGFESEIASIPSGKIQALAKEEISEAHCCDFEPESNLLHELEVSKYSPEERNSAIKVIWMGGTSTFREKLLFLIIDKILMEPCFDKLRTEQQLGYLVESKDEILRGVSAFGIIIMSSSYSCQTLYDKIMDFIEEMREEIEEMEKEEFDELLESLEIEIAAKFNNIYEESNFFWDEIFSRDYIFNRSPNFTNISMKWVLN